MRDKRLANGKVPAPVMATAAETKAGSVSKFFKKQKTPVRGATKVLRTAIVHPDYSLASQSTSSL